MRVGEFEFVEMMNVSYAEVERCDQYDFGWRDFRHQVEWDNNGSEG